MPPKSGVLEAKGGVGASAVEAKDAAGSADLGAEVRRLFAAASAEVFHDGMESQFSRAICGLMRKHGNAAVDAIGQMTREPSRSYEAASEALRWVGESDDPATRGTRLCLLEGALLHASAKVRDAAGIGLSSLGDPHAIPFLEAAVEREPVQQLREDLEQVLNELRGLKSCHS